LFDGLQAWNGIEQIGHKSQIQLGISLYNVSRSLFPQQHRKKKKAS
jgi:hypothetical protein